MRAETGTMQFGDDWPGVFIRGDNACHAGFFLRDFLRKAEENNLVGPVDAAPLWSLVKIFSQAEVHDGQKIQKLKSFEDCKTEEPEDPMKLIYSMEPIPRDSTIFLVGPTPRSDKVKS